MPQLDVATFASQIFWLSLCFIAVLVFSLKVSLPRLSRLLLQRWDENEGRKQKAIDLNQQVAALQQEIDEHLNQAKNQAQQEILQMMQQLSQETEQAKRHIHHQFKEKLQKTEEDLALQRLSKNIDPQEIAEKILPDLLEKILEKAPLEISAFPLEPNRAQHVH